MRTRLFWVGLMSTLPAAAPAFAETEDQSYCTHLAALYDRFVTQDNRGRGPGDLVIKTAEEQCASGDAAAAIAIIERKLGDNGFTVSNLRDHARTFGDASHEH
jgi:GNAT superfamily N-acetyltransferase